MRTVYARGTNIPIRVVPDKKKPKQKVVTKSKKYWIAVYPDGVPVGQFIGDIHLYNFKREVPKNNINGTSLIPVRATLTYEVKK